MMRWRGFVLFSLCLPGAARRSFRIDDFLHAREALIPGGFPSPTRAAQRDGERRPLAQRHAAGALRTAGGPEVIHVARRGRRARALTFLRADKPPPRAEQRRESALGNGNDESAADPAGPMDALGTSRRAFLAALPLAVPLAAAADEVFHFMDYPKAGLCGEALIPDTAIPFVKMAGYSSGSCASIGYTKPAGSATGTGDRDKDKTYDLYGKEE